MDGIEDRARALCEIGLRGGALIDAPDLPAAVDRYWPVFAVELDAGVINLAARRSLVDLESALAAYVAWKNQAAARQSAACAKAPHLPAPLASEAIAAAPLPALSVAKASAIVPLAASVALAARRRVRPGGGASCGPLAETP